MDNGRARPVRRGGGTFKDRRWYGTSLQDEQKVWKRTPGVVFKAASPTANSCTLYTDARARYDAWHGVHRWFEVQIDSAGDESHLTGAVRLKLSRHPVGSDSTRNDGNTMDIELAGPISASR